MGKFRKELAMKLQNSKWMICTLVVLVLFVNSLTFAKLTLSEMFGDNMVLQQGIQLPVWGWAEPNEPISVTIKNDTAQTVTDCDGNWKVKLAPLSAGGPYDMFVKSNHETVQITNVLIGEVWICAGQSNMEMGASIVNNGKREVNEANYPSIRLFKIAKKTSGIPLLNFPKNESYSKWVPCNPITISEGGWHGFSATAYFFGRELHQKLHVPVGLIDSSWGGTRIEPWTPRVGFAKFQEFSAIIKEIDRVDNIYNSQISSGFINLELWLKTAQKEFRRNHTVSGPPWPEHQYNNNNSPGSLYNAMLNPVVPFALRGAIWYQGESNCDDGHLYVRRMQALIEGLRAVWGQGDFPFYYVQLAPFKYGTGQLPSIWQAQLDSLIVKNTGMVITTDLVDDLNDIHPVNKQEVGKRLALWALSNTYGLKNISFSGPLFSELKIENNHVRVFFKYAANGLRTRNGAEPDNFEIAESDLKFVKAQAKIDGNTVVLFSPNIKKPVAARLGWNEIARPNLINMEGLPASPFSSVPNK